MMSNSPWICCANRCTNTKYSMGHFTFPAFSLSFSFAPFLPYSVSFSLSSFSPALSCSLNLSLSLCEGHAIDFPLSIHFSRLALKRGKQTKATPAPPLRSIPLLSSTLHLPSLSAAHPKTPDKRECGGMQPPPPNTPHPNFLTLFSFFLPPLFLSLFLLHLFLPLLSGLRSLSARSLTTFH